MYEQVKISTEIENMRKWQTEVTEQKTMTKILVEGFNSKLDQMKEMITKLKDRALKFIQLEEQKEKKKKEWKEWR